MGMSNGEFVVWCCAFFVVMREHESYKRGKGRERLELLVVVLTCPLFRTDFFPFPEAARALVELYPTNNFIICIQSHRLLRS